MHLRLAPGLFFSFLSFFSLIPVAEADFGNYNSILLGARAAGMGGAAVALPGDPDAGGYYNPATLSRTTGTNFSASASVYNKYDTTFSGAGNFSDSTLKINRGSFQAIPSSTGTAESFGTFAFALSVISPDYDIFNGDITLDNFPGSTTFVNYKDQSIWVGGSLAVNFTDDFAAGLSIYYTSRDYQRSTSNQALVGNSTRFSYETKNYTSNNFVYILGAYYRLSSRWAVGVSWQAPSIQLSGSGAYYLSTIDTTVVNATPVVTSKRDIAAQTNIPQRLSLGAAYEVVNKFMLSGEISIHGSGSFEDLVDPAAGEIVSYRQMANYALGAEYYIWSWLNIRGGVFTNFSSHPDISDSGSRQGDHIDMLGFSSNIGVFSGKTSMTFGGYFTGGRGQSTQQINQRIVVVPKTQYIYSMLLSAAYAF